MIEMRVLGDPSEAHVAGVAERPLERLGGPDEVAAMIACLVSE